MSTNAGGSIEPANHHLQSARLEPIGLSASVNQEDAAASSGMNATGFPSRSLSGDHSMSVEQLQLHSENAQDGFEFHPRAAVSESGSSSPISYQSSYHFSGSSSVYSSEISTNKKVPETGGDSAWILPASWSGSAASLSQHPLDVSPSGSDSSQLRMSDIASMSAGKILDDSPPCLTQYSIADYTELVTTPPGNDQRYLTQHTLIDASSCLTTTPHISQHRLPDSSPSPSPATVPFQTSSKLQEGVSQYTLSDTTLSPSVDVSAMPSQHPLSDVEPDSAAKSGSRLSTELTQFPVGDGGGDIGDSLPGPDSLPIVLSSGEKFMPLLVIDNDNLSPFNGSAYSSSSDGSRRPSSRGAAQSLPASDKFSASFGCGSTRGDKFHEIPLSKSSSSSSRGNQLSSESHHGAEYGRIGASALGTGTLSSPDFSGTSTLPSAARHGGIGRVATPTERQQLPHDTNEGRIKLGQLLRSLGHDDGQALDLPFRASSVGFVQSGAAAWMPGEVRPSLGDTLLMEGKLPLVASTPFVQRRPTAGGNVQDERLSDSGRASSRTSATDLGSSGNVVRCDAAMMISGFHGARETADSVLCHDDADFVGKFTLPTVESKMGENSQRSPDNLITSDESRGNVDSHADKLEHQTALLHSIHSDNSEARVAALGDTRLSPSVEKPPILGFPEANPSQVPYMASSRSASFSLEKTMTFADAAAIYSAPNFSLEGTSHVPYVATSRMSPGRSVAEIPVLTPAVITAGSDIDSAAAASESESDDRDHVLREYRLLLHGREEEEEESEEDSVLDDRSCHKSDSYCDAGEQRTLTDDRGQEFSDDQHEEWTDEQHASVLSSKTRRLLQNEFSLEPRLQVEEAGQIDGMQRKIYGSSSTPPAGVETQNLVDWGDDNSEEDYDGKDSTNRLKSEMQSSQRIRQVVENPAEMENSVTEDESEAESAMRQSFDDQSTVKWNAKEKPLSGLSSPVLKSGSGTETEDDLGEDVKRILAKYNLRISKSTSVKIDDDHSSEHGLNCSSGSSKRSSIFDSGRATENVLMLDADDPLITDSQIVRSGSSSARDVDSMSISSQDTLARRVAVLLESKNPSVSGSGTNDGRQQGSGRFSSSGSSRTASIDYGSLSRDLDEIQMNLDSLRSSERASIASRSSSVSSLRSGALLVPTTADHNISFSELCPDVPTTQQSQAVAWKDSSGSVNVNPLLTSGFVPMDLALDLIHGGDDERSSRHGSSHISDLNGSTSQMLDFSSSSDARPPSDTSVANVTVKQESSFSERDASGHVIQKLPETVTNRRGSDFPVNTSGTSEHSMHSEAARSSSPQSSIGEKYPLTGSGVTDPGNKIDKIVVEMRSSLSGPSGELKESQSLQGDRQASEGSRSQRSSSQSQSKNLMKSHMPPFASSVDTHSLSDQRLDSVESGKRAVFDERRAEITLTEKPNQSSSRGNLAGSFSRSSGSDSRRSTPKPGVSEASREVLIDRFVPPTDRSLERSQSQRSSFQSLSENLLLPDVPPTASMNYTHRLSDQRLIYPESGVPSYRNGLNSGHSNVGSEPPKIDASEMSKDSSLQPVFRTQLKSTDRTVAPADDPSALGCIWSPVRTREDVDGEVSTVEDILHDTDISSDVQETGSFSIPGRKKPSSMNMTSSERSYSETVQDVLERGSPPRQAYEYLREAEELKQRSLSFGRSPHSTVTENELYLDDSMFGTDEQLESLLGFSPIPRHSPFNVMRNVQPLLTSQLDRAVASSFDRSIEMHSPVHEHHTAGELQQSPVDHRRDDFRDSGARYSGLPEISSRDPDGRGFSSHQRPWNADTGSLEHRGETSHTVPSSGAHVISLPHLQLGEDSSADSADEERTRERISADGEDRQDEIVVTETDSNLNTARSAAESTGSHLSSVSVSGKRRSSNESSNWQPYQPGASNEIYYVDRNDSGAEEMSVGVSETTVESTHPGSDDAKPPNFPPNVLGSRAEGPPGAVGIYNKQKLVAPSAGAGRTGELSTILEQASTDARESSAKSTSSSEKSRRLEKEQSVLKAQAWVSDVNASSTDLSHSIGKYLPSDAGPDRSTGNGIVKPLSTPTSTPLSDSRDASGERLLSAKTHFPSPTFALTGIDSHTNKDGSLAHLPSSSFSATDADAHLIRSGSNTSTPVAVPVLTPSISRSLTASNTVISPSSSACSVANVTPRPPISDILTSPSVGAGHPSVNETTEEFHQTVLEKSISKDEPIVVSHLPRIAVSEFSTDFNGHVHGVLCTPVKCVDSIAALSGRSRDLAHSAHSIPSLSAKSGNNMQPVQYGKTWDADSSKPPSSAADSHPTPRKSLDELLAEVRSSRSRGTSPAALSLDIPNDAKKLYGQPADVRDGRVRSLGVGSDHGFSENRGESGISQNGFSGNRDIDGTSSRGGDALGFQGPSAGGANGSRLSPYRKDVEKSNSTGTEYDASFETLDSSRQRSQRDDKLNEMWSRFHQSRLQDSSTSGDERPSDVAHETRDADDQFSTPHVIRSRNAELSTKNGGSEKHHRDLTSDRRDTAKSGPSINRDNLSDVTDDLRFKKTDRLLDDNVHSRKTTESKKSRSVGSDSIEKGSAEQQVTKATTRKHAWIVENETLPAVPENTTLDSVTTDFTSSSSIDETGKIVTRTTKRNLPDDPKLLRLHQKITQQREKHMKAKLNELRRKEKIAKMEQKFLERRMAVRRDGSGGGGDDAKPDAHESWESNFSSFDSSTSTTMVSSTTLSAEDSESTLCDHSTRKDDHLAVSTTSEEFGGVCTCGKAAKSASTADSPSKRQHAVRSSKSPSRSPKLELQQVDYAKGTKSLPTFPSHASPSPTKNRPATGARGGRARQVSSPTRRSQRIQQKTAEPVGKTRGKAGSSRLVAPRSKDEVTGVESRKPNRAADTHSPKREHHFHGDSRSHGHTDTLRKNSKGVQTTPRLSDQTRPLDKSVDCATTLHEFDDIGVISIPLSGRSAPLRGRTASSHIFTPDSSVDVSTQVKSSQKIKSRPKPGPKVVRQIQPSLAWFIPVSTSEPDSDGHCLKEIQDPVHGSTLQDLIDRNGDWIEREMSYRHDVDKENESHLVSRKDQISEQLHRTVSMKPIPLREAFAASMVDFVSRSRERQRYVSLRAEERRLQELEIKERERLFGGRASRTVSSNTVADPAADHLYRPRKRSIGRREMKDLTTRHYQDESQAERTRKRMQQIRANRSRMEDYAKKILNRTLEKQRDPRQRSRSGPRTRK